MNMVMQTQILNNEQRRQLMIEKSLDCKIIRINKSKKSLIDNLLKRPLGLEFKSNHSIKSKCLKWIVKNVLSPI